MKMRTSYPVFALMVCSMAAGALAEEHVSLDSDDSALQSTLGESLKGDGFGKCLLLRCHLNCLILAIVVESRPLSVVFCLQATFARRRGRTIQTLANLPWQ